MPTQHHTGTLLLTGAEIVSILHGQELRILEAVRSTYLIHARGNSRLPHSSFLRFPGNDTDRIIALPAFLGEEVNLAGIKWIASFPGNTALGLERASAVLLLNSARTGHLQAILEGSVISAKRTAASAALAAHHLLGERELSALGVIGCGPINFETVRFLRVLRPEIGALFIHDLNPTRSEQFRLKCRALGTDLEVVSVATVAAALEQAFVTSIATTATTPHISDISGCRAGAVVLHTSLRDLAPEILLASDNIVDDIDHVCRAQTSVHLAEQRSGNRDFIRCTLADILNGGEPRRVDEHTIRVFSPFGLGVLDLAVGHLAMRLARDGQRGTLLGSFLPAPWQEREADG